MHDEEGGPSTRARDENCDDWKEMPRVVGHNDVGSRDLVPNGSPAADRQRPGRFAEKARGDERIRRTIHPGQATGQHTTLEPPLFQELSGGFDELLHPSRMGSDEARDE
jgi:hypothetical protein